MRTKREKLYLLLLVLFILLNGFITITGDLRDGQGNPFNQKGALPGKAALHTKTDSALNMEACQIVLLSNRGTGVYGSVLGFTHISEADTCEFEYPYGKRIPKDKYFLTLSGYKLKDGYRFYTRNGKYFMGEENAEGTNGHDKEISVRFIADNLVASPFNSGNKKGTVLLPVSQKTFQRFSIPLSIVPALVFLFALYALIVLPFQFFRHVFRTSITNAKSIELMGWMGWGFIACYVIPILAFFAVRLFMQNSIPGELYLATPYLLFSNNILFFGGTLMLVLRIGAQKGPTINSKNDKS